MKTERAKTVIFADIDGTILNEKYEYTQAEPVIHQLLSLKAAIVLTSSKTRGEIDFYRRKLGIKDPFIVENGSAVFVPKGYFKAVYEFSKQIEGFDIIELGCAYSAIREKIELVRQKTCARIVGFGDMTAEEIAEDSGLPLRLARLAKKREYDEPLKVAKDDEEEVLRALTAYGLCYTRGGRYFHVTGNCDKGKAVVTLKNLYSQEFDRLITIGVGDSPNDIPMMRQVEKPFLLGKDASEKAILKIWRQVAKTTAESQSSVQPIRRYYIQN